MEGFKVRLINEQYELEDKLTKLNQFISSDKITQLEPHMQELLRAQSMAMTDYNNILIERLSLLGIQ